jgi:K+-sensing histidine kinase KdpD
MPKVKPSFSIDTLPRYFWALVSVGVTTLVLYSIGRATLGEAVIALLYLVPVGWIASRWGHGPGICAAVAAALCFDFFFIPPFFTFTVGNLEGWLVLVIFLLVAVVIVGRIQSGLSQAKAHEKEAIFMYELSLALADSQTPEMIGQILAEKLQELYQAALVQVTIQPPEQAKPVVTRCPQGKVLDSRPDRVVPMMGIRRMTGEIWLWQQEMPLPAADNRLLNNYASQGAWALERLSEIGVKP